MNAIQWGPVAFRQEFRHASNFTITLSSQAPYFTRVQHDIREPETTATWRPRAATRAISATVSGKATSGLDELPPPPHEHKANRERSTVRSLHLGSCTTNVAA